METKQIFADIPSTFTDKEKWKLFWTQDMAGYVAHHFLWKAALTLKEIYMLWEAT